MRCYIDGISHKGEGVGRINGKAAFIPFAIPEETVEITLVEENKNYIRAELINIIECSKDRIEPDCPHFYECGGCAYQHVSYQRQLELKRQIVKDSLQRIGKIDCEVNAVIGMADPWRYRNKVEWHLKNQGRQVRMGYYKNGSNDLIDIKTCKLISQAMEGLSFKLKEKIISVKEDQKSSMTIRESSLDHALLAILNEVNIASLDEYESYPRLKSIFQQQGKKIKLQSGTPGFQEQINKTRYNLSPLSFFQVNPLQTFKLYELVKDYCQLQPDHQLLDCFCGVGSISLYLAPFAKKVTGVESYAPAIDNARENARLNQISNCEFIAGPCEKVVPQIKGNFDTVVLDPPRAGCKPELIQAVIDKNPKVIVYVSCNPSTLARDLAGFVNNDYTVEQVQPVDMFPQTHHIECVVRLDRKHS